MKSPDGPQSDPALIAALFVNHGDELRRFLVAVLRNPDWANDVLQTTFAKAIELAHTVNEKSFKGWLFRVAYHEALALRRRQGVEQRAAGKIAEQPPREAPSSPEIPLARWETIQQVRAALDRLPPEQREVVRRRIYLEQTFATIARDLDVPLGTVLTRMQLALKKLRAALERPE